MLEHEPAEDLLNMDGMDRELAYRLAKSDIKTDALSSAFRRQKNRVLERQEASGSWSDH